MIATDVIMSAQNSVQPPAAAGPSRNMQLELVLNVDAPATNGLANGRILSPLAESPPEFIHADEIMELPTEEPTTISGVLRYCQKRILVPYLRLLSVLGLKPCGIPAASDRLTCTDLVNKTYVGFVSIALVMGYIVQFLTCYRRDRGFPFGMTLEEHRHELFGHADYSNKSNNHTCSGVMSICSHAMPSILHFSSFLYMVYLYRIHEDEQLHNLMERVFIQTSHTRSNLYSQKRLVRCLQSMVAFSILWLGFSAGSQVTQIVTHSHNMNPWISVGGVETFLLVSFLVFSVVWQDGMQVTVIVSYSIHCRLLSTYFNMIHSRIQQHSITLHECIKEIGELDKLLRYVNNDLATGVGPMLLMDTGYALSTCSFIYNKRKILQGLDLITLLIIGLLWILMVLLPIFESAKLSKACKQVRELGHQVRMRPFGYQDTPQADLDSFLVFASTLKLSAHICGIPVSSSCSSCILTTILCALLIWGLMGKGMQ